MVDAIHTNADDTVLEIGPGLGTLTAKLAKAAKSVIAVEFDPDLARDLPKRVQAKNLEIIHQDILDFDLGQLPSGYKVAANVPYYITSKIVRLLLESPNPPSEVALLVQKEVAERLVAQPGEMSVLSVAAQFYADISLDLAVPAELFTPPPKVDSQIVRMTFTGPKFADIDPKEYFRVVKAGFSERRKKLRSSLSGGLHVSKTDVDQLLERAGIPTEARAQELTLDQWHDLAMALQS
jgi:16S rRNA (adenine1518-N6/adenine1519-N6)-dimethyltransferase